MIAPDLQTGIRHLARTGRAGGGGGALHRRRHLHRMRHPRLPVARRHLDQDAADRVRRLPGQPGDARRELAAALRHGGAVRRRQARPRPPGAGQALQGRQDSGRHHPEYRQSPSGFGDCGRSCGRVARQYHLCDLPRLRQTLRTGLGEAAFHHSPAAVRRIAPSATASSRPRRCRSASRCPRRPCGAPRS